MFESASSMPSPAGMPGFSATRWTAAGWLPFMKGFSARSSLCAPPPRPLTCMMRSPTLRRAKGCRAFHAATAPSSEIESTKRSSSLYWCLPSPLENLTSRPRPLALGSRLMTFLERVVFSAIGCGSSWGVASAGFVSVRTAAASVKGSTSLFRAIGSSSGVACAIGGRVGCWVVIQALPPFLWDGKDPVRTAATVCSRPWGRGVVCA
mmetsp:Transcript_117465/g.365843  ORF Transcript_117465/g.365843 Transcript_117465/m.365843 type:complete len:207 (+) Transcript_117465:1121-1741(+)